MLTTPSQAIPDQNHAILVRLFQILAPGKRDVVALIEAYFDESGAHVGSHALCVAGYLFEKTQCEALDLDYIRSPWLGNPDMRLDRLRCGDQAKPELSA